MPVLGKIPVCLSGFMVPSFDLSKTDASGSALGASFHAEGGNRQVKHRDDIRFGMNIDPTSACCIEKVKTGRTTGCCAHISTEDFRKKYKDAVQELEKTGQKIKPDPEVKAILEGEKMPLPVLKNEEKLTEGQAGEASESVSTSSLLKSTGRWVKWLGYGFAEDVKWMLNRKKSI